MPQHLDLNSKCQLLRNFIIDKTTRREEEG